MEHAILELSAEKYDSSVRGTDASPSLKERGDLAFYVKDGAMVSGKAAVCITFTVQMPDGSFQRAQAVTSAAMIEMVAGAILGWRDSGRIQ